MESHWKNSLRDAIGASDLGENPIGRKGSPRWMPWCFGTDQKYSLTVPYYMMDLSAVVFQENPEALEKLIAQNEHQAAPLKKGTRASIVWHDEEKKNITPYSIVYLHGFKGSQGEGNPVHRHIAKRFGCNLYLSRLHGHGQIKANKFDDLTPRKFMQSATDACTIGRAIGQRVLIMGTSTGGLLALYLASLSGYSSEIAGLILYSPLIHFYGLNSLLLEHGLSRKLLRLVVGSNYQLRSADPFTPKTGNIWYRSYHLNGALALGKAVQKIVSPALFRRVTCPVFLGYYYKSRHSHDRIVSTSAIRRTAKQLGTPPSNVTIKNFPQAGSHVICSSLLSHATDKVTAATEQFINGCITSRNSRGNG